MKIVEILPDLFIVDLALFIPSKKVVIISDLHIGYEEGLTKSGVLVPRFQFKDVIKRLDWILLKTKPETIIVNGDLKHEFGSVSNQEWRETLKLIDYLSASTKVVVVKGNHDLMIRPVLQKRNVLVVDYLKIDSFLLSHGDEIPKNLKGVKTIIIGHDHPAVSLFDGNRREVYKAFLKGFYRRKHLVVQPSFNPLVEGSDVLKEKMLSPLLQGSLLNFDVFVVTSKEVLFFGKLKKLK